MVSRNKKIAAWDGGDKEKSDVSWLGKTENSVELGHTD